METQTMMTTNRRRMVLKPLSPVTLQCKEKMSNSENNGSVRSQPPPTLLVSPTTDKKKILLQEFVLPEVSTVQRNKKVLLSYSGNEALTDSDDSDSDDSTINDSSITNSQKSNKTLYYTIFGFSCWAAVQYWMIAVAGFGAVFFAISALIAICLNTTKTNKKHTGLSAYSVFNPQCTPIQGSADPKQLERELIFGGL
ncbi:Uncharacterised domain SAYSvFN [Cinara cedri]|uniref:Uncharacterized domain SAYSvFN n=1 Tax=Cinara cedri TaxID=506608 RepID=A0A5E4LZB8_9HEMI|nr:Uncharacterised domain SAYSvFN [Cinara cedri]